MTLIDELGGVNSVARALGVSHGAVGNWRRRGWPDSAKWKLLELAHARGIRIGIDELARRLPAARRDAGGETGHAA